MRKPIVAVVRYEEPLTSVRKAVDLSGGLDHLPSHARVFLKPNVIFWTRATVFPKYGVITTSRLVEDAVVLLKERGIDDITIGEGLVTQNRKDTETPAHAFESLGYNTLSKRYGVKVLDLHQRPFEAVDLGDDVTLAFNTDYLTSDFLVNIPVLKCHAQTIVSLGIKNLKGLIDIPSRKKCHNDDPGRDLHFMVGKLATIVIGQGVHPVFVRSKALCDGMANGLSRLSGNGLDDRIQRLTLDQRHQGTPMALANHSITFPVTYSCSCFDDFRPFRDIDSLWNELNTCLLVAFSSFPAFFAKTWQPAIELTALLSIFFNASVDRCMA